jgi:hypothetical protein
MRCCGSSRKTNSTPSDRQLEKVRRMFQTNLKDPAMSIQSGNRFNFTSEFYDIGLMAAASPEFADQMARALLAADESLKAPDEAADAAATHTPA